MGLLGAGSLVPNRQTGLMYTLWRIPIYWHYPMFSNYRITNSFARALNPEYEHSRLFSSKNNELILKLGATFYSIEHKLHTLLHI